VPSPESSRDLEPPRTLAAGRAPLLWVVLPLLAGYLLADIWPGTSAKFLLLLALLPLTGALGLVSIIAAAKFSGRKSRMAWGACFLLTATLLAWAWPIVRLPTPPAIWARLPPREARVTVRVTYAFSSRPDDLTQGALGQIVVAPKILPELQGLKVYLRGRLRSGEPPPVRGALLEMDGLLAYVESEIAWPSAQPATASNIRFNAYLRQQRVWFTLRRWQSYREVEPPPPVPRWLAAQNERLENILRRGPAALETPLGDIYVAMLLGKTTLLDDAAREAFTLTGVMHLFAISGLHVAIMAGALWWCLRRVPRLPPLAGDLLTLALLWLYTEITGGSPSARRAALMFSFYVAARWLERPRGALAAVVAAAVVTLVWDPAVLSSAGFQLSYGVVVGLFLYALPLLHWARGKFVLWRDLPVASRAPWQKCIAWLWDKMLASAAISWTALLCSTPLTAEYFGVVSASGLLLNLLLVPLASGVLCSGAVAMLAGLAPFPPFTWLTWLANAFGLAATGVMEMLVQGTALIPGLHARLQLVPAWSGQVATLAVLAVMLAIRPRARVPRPWHFLWPLAVLAVLGLLAARPV